MHNVCELSSAVLRVSPVSLSFVNGFPLSLPYFPFLPPSLPASLSSLVPLIASTSLSPPSFCPPLLYVALFAVTQPL